MGKEPDRILFVHAHPDDETLSTGGTIATLIENGAAVTVLTCTRGERGEVIPAQLAHLEGRGTQLAEHRVGELAEAMNILGVPDHRYLGDVDARESGEAPRRYLDSGMVWGTDGPEPLPDLDATALCSAPLREVAADIAAVMASARPDAVISYDETGGYGHPDHIRVHDATLRAAAVTGVPFYTIIPPGADSDASATVRVDTRAVTRQVTDALRAHRTQVTVDDGHYALSSGPQLPIAVEERFRRIWQPVVEAVDESYAAQSLGARAFACTVALISGVVLGVLGTLSHQANVAIAGAAIPLGAIVALALVGALLGGLRLVFGHRTPALFAAVGLIAVLLLFAQASPGGSVLIAANTVGYAWTYGAPLIAALVLAWPSLPPGARGVRGVRGALRRTG